MMQAFQNLDFAIEVVFQFLVKLHKVDRLDSYKSARGLVSTSVDCSKATLAYFILDAERSN